MADTGNRSPRRFAYCARRERRARTASLIGRVAGPLGAVALTFNKPVSPLVFRLLPMRPS
jgi:hypothetical protein